MINKNNHFFTILKSHNKARVGKLVTEHGIIFTPSFLFCGTQGTIKTLENTRLKSLKTQILLCNTFHLLEDKDRIVQAGGIHKFIGWDGPILTDSGGYQVFSLGFGSVSSEIKGNRNNNENSRFRSHIVKSTKDDVTIRNPRNGNFIKISPEISIDLQCSIGVDFVVSMDECTPYHFTYNQTKKSLYKSIDWGKKSINYFNKNKKKYQKLYGIVQGGIHKDLRDISIQFLKDNPTDCIAIGGSLGKDKNQMYDVVEYTMDQLKDHINGENPRPVHLLGIGDKIDIIYGVDFGIDTFDCVSPTRLSRHGTALLSEINEDGKDTLNLKNASFVNDYNPIEQGCLCSTCESFSRSYINYLIKRKEPIVGSILAVHNIYAMNKFFHTIRQEILSDNWNQWKITQLNKFHKIYNINRDIKIE
jgi:queuine tRNA-ribosyltransferase